LAKIRTLGGNPSESFRIATNGVSPIRSRTDSTLFGSADETATNRRFAVARAMMISQRKLASAGNCRDDGNIIAFFKNGLQILQKTDVIAIDINVDEATYLSRFIANPFLDTREILLQIFDERFNVRALRAHFIDALSEFS
jgi:hypothetical protein